MSDKKDEQTLTQVELSDVDWSRNYIALGLKLDGEPESSHDWLALSEIDLIQMASAIRSITPPPSKQLIGVAEWAESVLVWKKNSHRTGAN